MKKIVELFNKYKYKFLFSFIVSYLLITFLKTTIPH